MRLPECFLNGNYKEGDFPVAEKSCRTTLALPIYPELMEDQKRRMVSNITEYYER